MCSVPASREPAWRPMGASVQIIVLSATGSLLTRRPAARRGESPRPLRSTTEYRDRLASRISQGAATGCGSPRMCAISACATRCGCRYPGTGMRSLRRRCRGVGNRHHVADTVHGPRVEDLRVDRDQSAIGLQEAISDWTETGRNISRRAMAQDDRQLRAHPLKTFDRRRQLGIQYENRLLGVLISPSHRRDL